jgi:predicted outer membrane repeat protein
VTYGFKQAHDTAAKEIDMRLLSALPSLALAICCTCTHAENAVVGTGSPGSCTTASYSAALALVANDNQGGQLSFNCGVNPHTIPVAAERSLQSQILIDGGGRITLDAQDQSRFFVINQDGPDGRTEVTLRGITLTRGNSGAAPFGGAILSNPNTVLNLDNVSILNSLASVSGGAIANFQNTTLLVRNSRFAGNLAANGGAIATRAAVTISNSVFTNNNASGGEGGAIQSYERDLTVEGSAFTGNGAAAGGAIFKRDAELVISDSNFGGNSAAQSGGAVHVVAAAREPQLVSSQFRANSAGDAGGGLFTESGATLAFVSFGGNSAIRGGAVWVNSGFFSALASTFHDNLARDAGGAIGIHELDLSFPSQFQLITTSGNTVSAGAGGDLFIRSSTPASAFLFRSTLMNATASASGSSVRVEGQAQLTVYTSLIWPRAGGACSAANGATLTSAGDNLRAATCALNAATDSTASSFASFGLGEFANYGGPHSTFPPLPGSPAIDRSSESFVNIDARGLPSPVDGDGNGSVLVDLGAVERQRIELSAAQFRNGFEDLFGTQARPQADASEPAASVER